MNSNSGCERLESQIAGLRRAGLAQKRTGNTQRNRDDRMWRVFLAAPVGMGVVVNQVFQEVNAHFCEITGYDIDELVGHNERMIYPSDEECGHAGTETYKQVGHTGTNPVDTRLKRKDGKTIVVSMQSTPLDPDDLSAGVILTALDITEQRRAKKELEEVQIRNWQLKKAESLNRMAGAVAHHFNNHLMGIMGNLELCLKVINQNESPLRYLTECMKAAHKAADVSGLMLTYLGQSISCKVPTDIGKVCRMSLSLLRPALPAAIRLKTNFPSCGPLVHGNASQIQQIVANLVTNAAESYAEQGAVHLTVKTARAREIPKRHRFPIDWHPCRNEYACVEVADSGCGIEEQNIEKIFDPFYSTKSTGRGLDLPVVLGIVKANSGVITVQSKRGEGSTFRFFAPMVTDPISRHPD